MPVEKIEQEDWLVKAIRQHPERISLMLARTEPVRFKRLDFMDFVLMYKEANN
mgnify:FL=1